MTGLFLLALFAYGLGTLIKFLIKSTTIDQNTHDFKLIPADIVLLTISINIGSALNTNSAFRLIPDNSRMTWVLILVLFSLFIYCLLIYGGKKIHYTNQESMFCSGNSLIIQAISFFAGLVFIVGTFVIAFI